MNVIYYELPEYGDDVLMHYGRKGMKWYQHIFSAAETVGRGTKTAVKTTARAVGSGVKSAQQASKAHREKRLADAKAKAIATGDYAWLTKNKAKISDEDIAAAKKRMDSLAELKSSAKRVGPDAKTQKKIDAAIKSGNYKKIAKLQSKMSASDYEEAYKRLDTQKKISDIRYQENADKKLRALKVIADVGEVSFRIANVAFNKAKLKDEKAHYQVEKAAERKEKAAERKEKAAEREAKAAEREFNAKTRGSSDPFRKLYAESVNERAKAHATEAASKTKDPNLAASIYASVYNTDVTRGINAYEGTRKGDRSAFDVDFDNKKKKKK